MICSRPYNPAHGVDIRVGRKASTLEIVVADKGIGIPEQKRDKIFDAFYTTRHTGTGLGLAIVDRLVKQHHGTVEVESVEGEGTTFTLRIPP